MEDTPRTEMEKSSSIMRRSIFTFLQNYHLFTIAPALLAFPYSVSLLLSQIFVPPSSLLQSIHARLDDLFQASGFPSSSDFFTILSLKLSQTIFFSVFALPFTLSFFLVAKATVIELCFRHRRSSKKPCLFSSVISLYRPLLETQICNFLLIISANATAFSVLFFGFNLIDGLGFSSPNWLHLMSAFGAVFYSLVLANAFVISNIALVSSGMDKSGGYLSILKACVVIKGRTSTALSLALPLSLAVAAIEALFHYRIVRAYGSDDFSWFSMVSEGILIAYLYSMVLVLDTVVSCLFFDSCTRGGSLMEHESKNIYRIEIAEGKMKNVEDLP
ncbi:putative pentatricopeptide repeat-containing protein [Hibiscus syriacus]|uniref:Pentatricopeptide repeat-containing protein n=1 Tax=Hibiscus syriacus TaxID=106335 RepID=A0A6A2XDW6_HIBSY|nr:uncharacterized protein LOC120170507 [Hibiscus syriacus]KAE8673512.1 putative pentatricopeptide repeat-containing protein [Hibiscus syriacus]